MKAVNLIPQDSGGRGGNGRPTRGMGAYIVLALLAAAVVVSGANAYTGRQLTERQAALANAERSAQAAEAQAAALESGADASSTARVETIAGLLEGRFDWSHSLREVARAVPRDVDLVSLVGTVAPSSVMPAGGGASQRADQPVPAIDLVGCAPSHPRVATLLTRLRALDGVQRVSLAKTEKSDSASLNDTDCRATDAMPQFQVTVFYDPPDGLVPAADAAAATGAAAPTEGAAPADAPAVGER